MNELPRAARWLYGRLIGGSVASRVAEGVAPSTWSTPFIVFQVQSPGTDRGVLNAGRVWLDPLYLVRAIAPVQSWTTLTPIADEIDAALHGASGSVSGALVRGCVRESAFSLIETINGTEYRHLGGLYRVTVQGVPA